VSEKVKKNVPKDRDIREPLFMFLEETYGKIRILEEKNIGRSRADIMMVTEEALYGIEIKSDADSYTRLADQVKDYDRFFDRNIVAVGSTHGEHIIEHVPPYWGIITIEIVDGNFDFYFLRKPSENPGMKWKKKLGLLWRPELAQIQEWNDMPKYKALGKDKVCAKILERVPSKISEEMLKRQVSAVLFERDYSNVAALLKEYRKGEIEKQLEREEDPEKIKELLEKQAKAKSAGKNLGTAKKKRYRRRRRV